MKTLCARDDFGARGDGRTDDTAALQRALDTIAARGGTLEIPVGRYLTRSLAVRRRDRMPTMSILGHGAQVPRQVAGFAATELVYIGPPRGTVLSLYGLNGGRVEGFNVDGNGLAETGVLLESSIGLAMDAVIAVGAIHGYGFVLKGTDAGVYRCLFSRLGSAACAGGMLLTGTGLAVDVAECSFVRTDLDFDGPLEGMRIESADNCDFLGTSLVGPESNRDPLLMAFCPPSSTTLGANRNRFHGLDGSAHRIIAESPYANAIFGLSHGNGIPEIGGTQAKCLTVVQHQ